MGENMRSDYGSRISKERLAEIKEVKESVMYDSKYTFLMDQGCWRPGDLHCLLGMESSGKSSLVRSLIIEAAFNIPVLGFLSEETSDDIWYELDKSVNLLKEKGLIPLDSDPLSNVTLLSETDRECSELFKSQDEILAFIRKYLIKTKAKLFILDNITTSKWYRNLPDQEAFVDKFKTMAKHENIPVFIVAHTSKQFLGNTLMRSGNIRGNNLLAMLAEHFYCFNNTLVDDPNTGKPRRVVILQVVKHRGINRDDYLFCMEYDSKIRLYTGSIVVNLSLAKKLLDIGKQKQTNTDTSTVAGTNNSAKKLKETLAIV